MLLVDTSAWVELLRGSPSGAVVRKLLRGNSTFAVGISLAELSKWCHRNAYDTGQAFEEVIGIADDVLHSTRVSEQRAGQLWAGVNAKRSARTRIGLVDCLLAAIAEENDLTIVTRDQDFRAFPVPVQFI